MSPRDYRDASAFRVSLETRLRQAARVTATPLDRLRKEVAHQRLLARLVQAAPPGSWALKGGQVLLARLGPHARATKDADATWRESGEAFGAFLEQAVELDLEDYFTFEVAEPRHLEAETGEGGFRYSVLARVDGREFERLQLDINFVVQDPRPIEQLQLRDLLGFAEIEPPQIPVVPVAQHLAEKLHAYTRDYVQANSRPRDLFDMLVIALHLPLPDAADFAATLKQTFDIRQTDWPPRLTPPPTDWANTWSAYVQDHAIPWSDLDAAYHALGLLMTPLLDGSVQLGASWSATEWAWIEQTEGLHARNLEPPA
jgi:predicted nucleotidyltransferase component of viral defense system